MSWWAVDVRTDPARRDRLSAWLVGRTGQAVEERDDGTLVTFAADEAGAEALLAALEGEPPKRSPGFWSKLKEALGA